MKPIIATLDATTTGVATLINSENTSPEGLVDMTNTFILTNTHNVGSYVTVQLIFEDPAPVFNIEVNLGKIVKEVNFNSQTQQTVVDPDGWAQMPGAILSPDSSSSVVFGYNIPFFALRVNIKTAGTGTGTIKLLQQGIV